MGPDELELIEASLAVAIPTRSDSSRTDGALDELGWSDILDAEFPQAVAAVFAHLGTACAASTALDSVIAHRLQLPRGATIVHPRWSAADPSPIDRADSLSVDGTVVGADADTPLPEAVWVLHTEGAAAIAGRDLELHRPTGDSRLAHVTASGAAVQDRRERDRALVAATLAEARLAIAHELNGLASGMLEAARVHALDRVQFGRPIAAFQAIRHKLAETLVAVTAAAEALAAATAEPADDSFLVIDTARVLAGIAAQSAMRNSQQVLAGIGFTREHDFHAYLFAALELDGLYGTTEALTASVGRRLLARGSVPRLIDL